MHRECPEKTNTESVLSYCSCIQVEGEKPHSAEAAAMRKEKSTMSSQGILWEDVLL
jgi:hypothetical protein